MQVNLSWHSVTNALYYKIYRSTVSGGPYQFIAQSNPNPGQTASATNIITTFQDGPNNISNGITYYYVVTTVTADGESAYSSQYTATAPSAPAAPSNLTGTVT